MSNLDGGAAQERRAATPGTAFIRFPIHPDRDLGRPLPNGETDCRGARAALELPSEEDERRRGLQPENRPEKAREY